MPPFDVPPACHAVFPVARTIIAGEIRAMTAFPEPPGPRVAAPATERAADVALLDRAAAGDERALGDLYDRYGATVYALAKAIVKSEADAEDVVAAVFAQAWRGAGTYDAARGAVSGWLCTMARTRALDLLRARRRRAKAEEGAAADNEEGLALPLASPPPAPDAGLVQAEDAALVARSLATLPEPQRRVIELAYFGGLSQSDIAARLQEPLGTVKTRMRSGMEKLRLALAPIVREGRA